MIPSEDLSPTLGERLATTIRGDEASKLALALLAA